MSVKVTFKGLDDFLREFGSIPQQLTQQGMEIIREETEGAAVEIAQGYARKTGRLARAVKTFYPSSTILIGKVLSRAPHSHLYEFGTKLRRTHGGANRGVMPEKAVSVPIARRRRARMARRLIDLLKTMGFQIGQA